MRKRSVERLFKDPEKVLLKLALPVILANGFQTLYNFMDAFWVSLLKNSKFSLSGIGLAMPFAFSLIAIANGIGVGTNSLLSRKIGSGEKEKADKGATVGLSLSFVLGVFIGVTLFIFARPLFMALSPGEAGVNATQYAQIIFIGAPFLFISSLLAFILRAEGDMKRSMMALATGSVLNMFLDPLFIFAFNMGIRGAAFATVFSRFLTIIPLSFWMFKQKSSYIRPCWKKLNLNPAISIEILKVGIPSSLSLLFMSLGVFAFNMLIQKIYGAGGVAVYIAGSRINSLAVLPALGIQAAVITLTGIWYGAGRKDMLKRTVLHAWKTGITMELFIAIFIFFFAKEIGKIFAHDATMQPLIKEIATYLRITSPGFIFMPISMFSVGTFNGTGKASYGLLLTLIRVIVISYPSAVIYSILLGLGLHGIWGGILTGNILASFVGIFLLKVKKLI